MDIESEPRQENVEDWSFVFVGNSSAEFTVRVDRGEKGTIDINAIDQTPVSVSLLFRDDKTNEVKGGLRFPVCNLLSYGMTKRMAPVYATGESPVEKELARRREALEQRIKDREVALSEGL